MNIGWDAAPGSGGESDGGVNVTRGRGTGAGWEGVTDNRYNYLE